MSVFKIRYTFQPKNSSSHENCTVYKYSGSMPVAARRRCAPDQLLRFLVRIKTVAWISVSCECCVLSGRGLCGVLNTRTEESYRLWCVLVCDVETS